MHNDEFWLSIGISFRELDELTDSFYLLLKGSIESYPSHRPIFEQFFDVDHIDPSDIGQIRELAATTAGKEFYGLFLFQKEKIPVLQEFFGKLNAKKAIVQVPNRPILCLLELYRSNPALIVNSRYYCRWNRLRLLESWYSTPPITEKTVQDFASSKHSLLIHAKNILRKSTRLEHAFELDGDHYFFYERQKKDSVIDGYAERKPVRKRGQFSLRISPKNNKIEIRSQDPRVSDLFHRIFSDLKCTIFVDGSIPVQRSLGDIAKNLLEKDGNGISVTQLTFHYLEKNVGCQATFKKTSEDTIKDCLEPLRQEGLIDPSNHRAIKNFVVDVDGISRTVILEREQDSTTFHIRREGLSDKKFTDIVALLRTEYGIDVETPYYEEPEHIDKKCILQQIIGKARDKLTQTEQKIYQEVAPTGVFHTNTARLLVCSNNTAHRFPKASKSITDQTAPECPVCGNRLIELEPKEIVSIDQGKLIAYLKERLSKIFGDSRVDIVSADAGVTRQFLKLRDVHTDVFIYPYYEGHVKGLLRKWEEGLSPSIQVIAGKKAPELSEFKLSSAIYLYDFLFDDEKKIKNDIERATIREYEYIVQSQSQESAKKLRQLLAQELKLTGEEFETVCYPMLKLLFYEVVHWGKNTRFKYVPDGIYGIKMSPRKRDAFSLIYDCKCSASSYDLDADEKRKSKDYIKRANQSKGVKLFSGKLSAYMIIGQNVSEEKFTNLCAEVQKYKGWKGKLVLLKTSELLTLYEKFEDRYKHNSFIKIAVSQALAEHIRQKSERTIILCEEDIKQIFELADKIEGKFDVDQVLEHMKSNVEY